MSDETEDDESRDPEPYSLADGEILIYDGPEFFDTTGSIVAQNREGGLFVLLRSTLKWASVEALKPKKATLSSVKD